MIGLKGSDEHATLIHLVSFCALLKVSLQMDVLWVGE